jgi:hypothetical protein
VVGLVLVIVVVCLSSVGAVAHAVVAVPVLGVLVVAGVFAEGVGGSVVESGSVASVAELADVALLLLLSGV